MDITRGDDFYEDDEPVENVKAAFERGTKGVTAPQRGFNLFVAVPSSDVVVVPDSMANAPVHASA
ncbi:hypothetical protein EV644_106430 [Kribbella orskensis]|uniref:Uncharacterized protein n=1 Tax=Kribbella orskensis TaxID=2512216 RepID=A0ABY2BKK2_9ACTN|nr:MULTISPECIES: hypothetical protein [Kribbella]TCN40501.1 hypothetical protein EV642_105430 [Kribbella sp. VKM Ac-2500]TCO23121.1 hypothetical protein EV644_106430 [Kribbella orskensis]